MSIQQQQQPSFLISLAVRASGSAGFARSLLAICTMWLLPELKPAIHYNHRKKTPLRRSKRRSTTSTTPSSPTSTTSPSPTSPSPLQRPLLKPSRRSSFAVVLSTITSRKWSSSSTPSSDITSSSTSDSDSSPSSFRRPRLSFSPHLPKMKRSLSITQCPNSLRQCDPMARSKTTSAVLFKPTKAPKKNAVFTHPWRMSRSHTSSTPSSTPSPTSLPISSPAPSEFITTKPNRLPFKRGISFSRPTPLSPLASPSPTPSSYFPRNHSKKESYSLYLRSLPRFEGSVGKPVGGL